MHQQGSHAETQTYTFFMFYIKHREREINILCCKQPDPNGPVHQWNMCSSTLSSGPLMEGTFQASGQDGWISGQAQNGRRRGPSAAALVYTGVLSSLLPPSYSIPLWSSLAKLLAHICRAQWSSEGLFQGKWRPHLPWGDLPPPHCLQHAHHCKVASAEEVLVRIGFLMWERRMEGWVPMTTPAEHWQASFTKILILWDIDFWLSSNSRCQLRVFRIFFSTNSGC